MGNGGDGMVSGLVRASVFASVAGAFVTGALALGGCMPVADAGGETQPSVGKASEGSLTIECSRLIAGGEREVRLSYDGVVSWSHETVADPLEGDGVSDSIDYYTFTPKAAGTVGVEIYDVLPWADTEMVEDLFWLVVDDDLAMRREEVDPVDRFELHYERAEGSDEVIMAEPEGESFLRLSCHSERSGNKRSAERSLDVTPRDITALFVTGGVFSWDGFDEAEVVEDGAAFRFTASLKSGKTITASGSNAFPDGFDDVRSALYAYLGGL